MKKEGTYIKLVLFLFFGSLLISLSFASFVIASPFHSNATSIFYNSGGLSCVKDSPALSAYWYNDTSGLRKDVMYNDVMNTTGNCSLYSAISGITCCPSNRYCWTDGKCHVGGQYCENYNTSSTCSSVNNQDSTVGQNSVNNGSAICGFGNKIGPYPSSDVVHGDSTCWDITYCTCAWNGSACHGNTNTTAHCSNGTDEYTYSSNGCRTLRTEGATTCDASGYITLTSIVNWTGETNTSRLTPGGIRDRANCKNSPRSYLCPQTARLPFFSMFNLLISVILVGIIYFFYRRR